MDDSVQLKKNTRDLDHDGMIDEILQLARGRDWAQDLVETCLDALSSKFDE